MPGRDRTGPMGRGPGTGWGMGPCRRSDGYGFGRRSRQMGFGRGGRRGYGMGFGPGFGPGFGFEAYDGRSDREVLEDERNWLQERLDAIAKELEEE